MTGKSLTCYAPFRRSPPGYCYPALPLDLHVLSLPLAFILSQDQTLLCIFLILQVRFRHSQFLLKKSTLSIFVLLVLASLYFRSSLFNQLRHTQCLPALSFRLPNSSQVLSEVPLFRNGIAKVGTFSEPANFSRTFFHFFFFTHPYCIILSH